MINTRGAGTSMGLAFALYNDFLPYLYDFQVGMISFLMPCRLSTRGATFGDGSLYITYRNVSATIHLVSHH